MAIPKNFDHQYIESKWLTAWDLGMYRYCGDGVKERPKDSRLSFQKGLVEILFQFPSFICDGRKGHENAPVDEIMAMDNVGDAVEDDRSCVVEDDLFPVCE